MIGIIAAAGGNIKSIFHALNRLNIKSKLIFNYKDFNETDKIILPGVGSFDHAMDLLKNSGLYDSIKNEVENKKKPILGICLGMQLMVEGSDEGIHDGFGWIKGRCKRLQPQITPTTRIPHIGWNQLYLLNKIDSFTQSLDLNARYYFLHSYAVNCEKKINVLANCDHGQEFDSIIRNNNVIGVQFHPERSGSFGSKVLETFSSIE